MTLLLDDAGVRTHLDAERALEWIAEALREHAAGELVAPPRVHADLGAARLVLTAGRLRGR